MAIMQYYDKPPRTVMSSYNAFRPAELCALIGNGCTAVEAIALHHIGITLVVDRDRDRKRLPRNRWAEMNCADREIRGHAILITMHEWGTMTAGGILL